MKKRATVFVLPVDGKWHVMVAGRKKAHRILDTQREAIQAGKALAISKRVEMVVMRDGGTIRSKDSFAKDPLPQESEHRTGYNPARPLPGGE